MSGKVYIIGIGSTALGRHPDKSVKDLTREAVRKAFRKAVRKAVRKGVRKTRQPSNSRV